MRLNVDTKFYSQACFTFSVIVVHIPFAVKLKTNIITCVFRQIS